MLPVRRSRLHSQSLGCTYRARHSGHVALECQAVVSGVTDPQMVVVPSLAV